MLSYDGLFKGALYDNYADRIVSKQYTTSEIDTMIKTEYSSDATMADILHEDMMDVNSTTYKTCMPVARSYSLTSGWTPPSGTKIILYHSKDDDTVPYSNLDAMSNFLDSVIGSGNYTRKNGSGNHVTAASFCVLGTISEW